MNWLGRMRILLTESEFGSFDFLAKLMDSPSLSTGKLKYGVLKLHLDLSNDLKASSGG